MPAVAAPADKRFRRAHLKPARKRKVDARLVWRLLRLAGVLGLALYGGWRGTALVLGAPALQVSRVTVTGNSRLSNGEVLAMLDGLKGQNVLSLDIEAWQQRLLASPWVESATLRRMLPALVEVTIKERKPIAIARLAKALYLIDATGIVIDEYGPAYADLDLPIVGGLAGRGSESVSAVDERRARLAARVVAALETRPDLASRISLIDVADPHDAVVMLDEDTASLRLGDQDFVDRIQEYLDLKPALHERVQQIDYVDMRFGERLYVRPAKK
jgi:cell division protein FtsQ